MKGDDREILVAQDDRFSEIPLIDHIDVGMAERIAVAAVLVGLPSEAFEIRDRRRDHPAGAEEERHEECGVESFHVTGLV